MAPQKWEYATFRTDAVMSGRVSGTGGFFKMPKPVDEALSEFGEQGWELVQVVTLSANMVYLFKRPKE
jgi:hypothetical protein